jgi:5'-3' exonuclease
MHSPSRVVFVLEGVPRQRLAVMPEYKANRKIDVDIDGEAVDPKDKKRLDDLKNFFRQKELIVDLLTKHFPVSVVRHPDYECDDVIYNLIRKSTTAVLWVVASNDSDFTQLLNEFEHVKVYNPMLKTYVQQTPYDYVSWKALRGDGSDNIHGIPGIGDKTAEELLDDAEKLGALFKDKDVAEQFSRNYMLIKFHTWTDSDGEAMTSSEPERDWDAVAAKFGEWEFKSLLKDKTWDKFTATFEPLWGNTILSPYEDQAGRT